MKIISKNKDFYDFNYMVEDTTNVYVRKTEEVDSEDKSVLEKTDKYMQLRGRKRSLFYNSDTCWGLLMVGVYPYIYLIDYITLRTPDYSQKCQCLSREIVYNKDMVEKLYNEAPKYGWYVSQKTILPYEYKKGKVYYRVWKEKIEWTDKYVEDKTLFELFKAPVFISDLNHIHKQGAVNVKLNPILIEENDKYVDLLKCIRETDPDIDITIYDRIENFLYSSKVMPESEPDNKTKIINAGFDLKTSFRKM